MRLFHRTAVPQGAAAGVAVGLPELGAGIPSALEQLLSKGRARATLAMLGPAFVASIAYVDPGNFATNFAAARGSATCCCGRTDRDVVAMLIQYLWATPGARTDEPRRGLPHACPRCLTFGACRTADRGDLHRRRQFAGASMA